MRIGCAYDADTFEGFQAYRCPAAGNHQIGFAGSRTFQDTVIRFVIGNDIYRDCGTDDLSNLGHQLEMPDDFVFLSPKPAEDFGDLAHDSRGNQ